MGQGSVVKSLERKDKKLVFGVEVTEQLVKSYLERSGQSSGSQSVWLEQ